MIDTKSCKFSNTPRDTDRFFELSLTNLSYARSYTPKQLTKGHVLFDKYLPRPNLSP